MLDRSRCYAGRRERGYVGITGEPGDDCCFHEPGVFPRVGEQPVDPGQHFRLANRTRTEAIGLLTDQGRSGCS